MGFMFIKTLVEILQEIVLRAFNGDSDTECKVDKPDGKTSYYINSGQLETSYYINSVYV